HPASALGGPAGRAPAGGAAAPAHGRHVGAEVRVAGGVGGLGRAPAAGTHQLEHHERTELLAAVLSRFSTVALASVGALVVTGAGQTIVHVERLDALTGTAFGRAILVKTALLGVLIGLGALNRQRTLP